MKSSKLNFLLNDKKIQQRIFDRRYLPVPIDYYHQYFPVLSVNPGGKWVNVNCCFHEDKNPSLSINIVSGGFYCFGCGAKGGDVIAFQMQRYNMQFIEAITFFGAWAYE